MKKNILLFILAVIVALTISGCSATPGNQGSTDMPITDMLEQIRSIYGEDYLPNLELSPEMLEAEFNLPEDMYIEAVGEMPMMSAHADRVVIVRATSGKGGEVEAALKDALDKKINAELQYPANAIKTRAAKVVRNGDYVAFFLVGAPLDDVNATEQDLSTHYEAEAQKAVETFNSFFS